VVGEAASPVDLLAQIASLHPDVILMELETGQDALAGSLWQIAEAGENTGVVLLCDANDRWSIDALRAGARGVLTRNATGAEIVAAVVAAGEGLVTLHPAVARLLVPVADVAPTSLIPGAVDQEPLTPREIEVLKLLSEGLGNKAISRRLSISEHTVKFHVGSIMAKLGAASRTEAVTQAARRGLIML
jgi:DNA-binding NarL/FixJ family response regulator